MPPATQDIAVNIKNRQKAIDSAAYGPMNPKEPDAKFWPAKAKRWNVSEEDAKSHYAATAFFLYAHHESLDA